MLCFDVQVWELLTEPVDKTDEGVSAISHLRIVLDVLLTDILRHSQLWLALVERYVEKVGSRCVQVICHFGLPPVSAGGKGLVGLRRRHREHGTALATI